MDGMYGLRERTNSKITLKSINDWKDGISITEIGRLRKRQIWWELWGKDQNSGLNMLILG